MLRHEEHLGFGQRYRFWLYGDVRQNRADLGRHLPISAAFDISPRPQQQSSDDLCHKELWNVSSGGDEVLDPWNAEIGLMVGSDKYRPIVASSKKRSFLTATRRAAQGAIGVYWHATTSIWGPNEKMLLVRCEYVGGVLPRKTARRSD